MQGSTNEARRTGTGQDRTREDKRGEERRGEERKGAGPYGVE